MSSGYSLWGNDNIEDRNAPVNNPITAFNFVLEVEGVYFMALKSVHVFNKENEYEYIREGGVNDYVHMRRKPISKPFTFQVERYVGTERFLDPLANGTELILPVILYVYRHKARSEIIDGAPAWPARIYTFTGCVVTAKEYGELNSEKSSILTETTTIAYRELVVVTNPFESGQELEALEEFGADTKPQYANPTHMNSKDYYTTKPSKEGLAMTYMKDGVSPDINKPRMEEFGEEAEAKYARTSKKDDEEPEHKLPRDQIKEGDEPLYASTKNANSGNYYTTQTDKDGKKYTTRKGPALDKDTTYKPSRSYDEMKKDTKAKYAASSSQDSRESEFKSEKWDIKQNKTNPKPDRAKSSAADATKPEVKGPWSIKNPNKDKSAKQSATDSSKPEAKGPWSIKSPDADKSAKQSPTDSSKPEAKGPWSIRNPGASKSAKASPADSTKPEAKGPWNIQNPDASKSAKASPADSSKPEAKGPWSIKSPDAAKSAVASPVDPNKPETKGPWDIKANTKDPKPEYALASTKDKEKPQFASTWPPTRRALMAEELSKKQVDKKG
ncbi:MAG: hypothetical protein K6G12_02515 [Lachnospiraceae bacterium]|nr:hypothetical protein [Lachnospiraceae bacterium]